MIKAFLIFALFLSCHTSVNNKSILSKKYLRSQWSSKFISIEAKEEYTDIYLISNKNHFLLQSYYNRDNITIDWLSDDTILIKHASTEESTKPNITISKKHGIFLKERYLKSNESKLIKGNVDSVRIMNPYRVLLYGDFHYPFSNTIDTISASFGSIFVSDNQDSITISRIIHSSLVTQKLCSTELFLLKLNNAPLKEFFHNNINLFLQSSK